MLLLAALALAADPPPPPAPANGQWGVDWGEQQCTLTRATPEARPITLRIQMVHRELDVWTCALIMKRARFEPALGPDSRPAESFSIARVSWLLPN